MPEIFVSIECRQFSIVVSFPNSCCFIFLWFKSQSKNHPTNTRSLFILDDWEFRFCYHISYNKLLIRGLVTTIYFVFSPLTRIPRLPAPYSSCRNLSCWMSLCISITSKRQQRFRIVCEFCYFTNCILEDKIKQLRWGGLFHFWRYSEWHTCANEFATHICVNFTNFLGIPSSTVANHSFLILMESYVCA